MNFHQPTLYINLLSNSESCYAVYSSTAADEFSARIPDSLLSGLATKQLILHCLPEIKNTNTLLMSDIAQILLAIKIASFGNTIEIQITCPNCKEQSDYDINLQAAISSLSVKKWFTPLSIDPLIINLYPPTYDMYSQYALQDYKISKQLYQISKLENIDDYVDITTSLVEQKKILALNYKCSCIKSIIINKDKTINNKKYIKEWFFNCDIDVRNKTCEYIEKSFKECSIPNTIHECKKCNSKYYVPIDLDICSEFRKQLITMNEQEIIDFFDRLKSESEKLTDELLNMIWFMRGSISYTEAYSLTNFERRCISKIIEKNVEISEKTKMPII